MADLLGGRGMCRVYRIGESELTAGKGALFAAALFSRSGSE